jgi:hypothetical protein
MWHVREEHELDIAAQPRAVFEAAKGVTPAEVHLMAPLFALRALPARLKGARSLGLARNGPILEGMVRSGFVTLGEVEGEEIALGAVGRFWQLAPAFLQVADADAFREIDVPGYAKAALSFLAVPAPGGCTLRTETRVLVSDDASRRRFLAYWGVIGPGSALIRRSWLNAVRRRALTTNER